MQIEKYKQREKHNITESTLNSRLSALNNLQNFMGSEREPEPEDVEDWVDHLIQEFDNDEISANTIKQYYKSVKYYWQKVHGDDEPIEHIRDWIPVGSTDHGDFLTVEELKQMRDSIYSFREKAIIELMYVYARRPSEIIYLNMSDINMEEGTIQFNILKKRDPFRATFELRDDARQVLEDYFKYRMDITVEAEHPWEEGEVEPVFTTNSGRISYDSVWRKIKDAAKNAGIDKNITPKSMRHSRSTHLDWAGQSPEVIARQQLVHNPESDTIGHYIHPRDEEDVREVMSLDGE